MMQLQTTYLDDYQVPPYCIDQVDLEFDLYDEHTLVKSCLWVRPNPESLQISVPLILEGEGLQLQAIFINEIALNPQQYELTEHQLILPAISTACEIKITTLIKPQKNTALSGLYKTNKNYCTQCEAQGFRRITYFMDRPDVMAVYSTKIIADKKHYPTLLSNGNLIARGDAADGRHWVQWSDPFKKACYLFALVAGDLACIEDYYETKSGRKITLQIYVEQGNQDKCAHAMAALKKAMKWDEVVYGREYDLDIFMIVAVSDFNMGAMENKGLNIFNDKYILANSKIATDADYKNVEVVVAHEYFHNWTGNRVTCRDWFQLSLKEGLTVFREQQFIADHYSSAIERIDETQYLRTYQFAEDASAMAHSVQPRSYIEINNFYTATVYNKGAEVIRIIHTLLGQSGFRKGMDLYFERHDGQAVTIEEFVSAMEEANQIDLAQLRLWYSQAGTPLLTIHSDYDATHKIYTLEITQTGAPTFGQPKKSPLLIPLKIGLLDEQGKEVLTQTLTIQKPLEKFHFESVAAKPILSLLRDFSAPVKIKYDYSYEELIFLLGHDSNGFARWEAGQILAVRQILELSQIYRQKGKTHFILHPNFIDAYAETLQATGIDQELQARLLALPSLAYLCEQVEEIDIDALSAARDYVRHQIAPQLKTLLLAKYEAVLTQPNYIFTPEEAAKRYFKNTMLTTLMWAEEEKYYALAFEHYSQVNNMTDRIAALNALSQHHCSQRQIALDDFYVNWQQEPLVMDKWLSIQATSELSNTLEQVKQLMKHPAFRPNNPNSIRALIGGFSQANLKNFHEISGKGYEFLIDQVLILDSLNPQIAARLLTPLAHWRKYDEKRKLLMQKQLERVMNHAGLSKDSSEVASKYLG